MLRVFGPTKFRYWPGDGGTGSKATAGLPITKNAEGHVLTSSGNHFASCTFKPAPKLGPVSHWDHLASVGLSSGTVRSTTSRTATCDGPTFSLRFLFLRMFVRRQAPEACVVELLSPAEPRAPCAAAREAAARETGP